MVYLITNTGDDGAFREDILIHIPLGASNRNKIFWA